MTSPGVAELETAVRALRLVRKSSADLPALHDPASSVSAGIIRRFVRTFMSPALLARMYDTAMGIAEFEQICPDSSTGTVELEAPPSVQANMMKTLMDIALPTNIKLADERTVLQGVVVLPPLGMRNARIAAEQQRLAPGPGGEVFPTGPAYERDPNLEYVVVDATPTEVNEALAARPTVAPPAVKSRAQEILARRRGQAVGEAKIAADSIARAAVEVATNPTPVSKNPAPEPGRPATTKPASKK